MKRKSQLSVQFNWIFVLIAGAIILTFFTTIIIRQRNIAEEKIATDLVKNLETEFTSAKAGTGTAAKIPLNEKEIYFKCDEYTIGDKVSQDVIYRPVFSPDLIKGQEMVLWSMPWRAPYKVNNFLFVTSPDVRYILIGNDTQILEMERELRNKFLNVQRVTDASTVRGTTGYKIKFVCWDCDLSTIIKKENLVGMPEEDIAGISINENTVKFYRMQTTMQLEKELPHLGFDKYGMPTIYAAMFSNDAVIYECNMRKAFANLKLVSTVYQDRMKAMSLQLQNTANAQCTFIYYTDHIYEIILASESYTTASVDAIRRKIPELEAQQQGARRGSCPLIY